MWILHNYFRLTGAMYSTLHSHQTVSRDAHGSTSRVYIRFGAEGYISGNSVVVEFDQSDDKRMANRTTTSHKAALAPLKTWRKKWGASPDKFPISTWNAKDPVVLSRR